MVEYTIKLDLSDNGYFDTGIRVKQGDYGDTRFVIFVVNNGESAFDREITPQIAFKRPDGRTVVSDLAIGDNAYSYTFVGNELQIAGPIIMDVKLEDDQGRISTASCKFTCVEDTIGYDPTGAKTYNNPVSEIAKEASINSENAEAWAVGKRDGVDVGPEDETYHNNAKYWSEKSGSSRLVSMDDVDINSPQDKQALVYDALTGKWINGQGSGGGGTSDYNDLTNRPRINGEELVGNKSADDLGLALKQDLTQYEQTTDEEIEGLKSSLNNLVLYETRTLTFDTNGATWIGSKSGYVLIGAQIIRQSEWASATPMFINNGSECGLIAKDQFHNAIIGTFSVKLIFLKL